MWPTNIIRKATVNNLVCFFPAESDLQSAISYPTLPLDPLGEGSGNSTPLHRNEHPPSPSHSSTRTHPSNEAHGTRMTGIPDTPAGSTPIPTSVTHTQPSHVPPGTDPLSSPGTAGQPTFQRRWVPLPVPFFGCVFVFFFLFVCFFCFFTVFSEMFLAYHHPTCGITRENAHHRAPSLSKQLIYVMAHKP